MKGRVSNYIVVLSFVLSVIIVTVSGFADAADTEGDSEEQASQPQGPLVVPIYPEFQKDDKEETPKLPEGADLRDSYIVLEDGSVLSVADWILGSLNKNNTGVGMSDYQNRLFLGQVARAMAGMDENLITRNVVNTGPAIPYTEPELAAPLQVLKALKNILFPEMPKNWSPATSGGGFTRNRWQEGHATVLFERQMSDAVESNSGDLWESGTMQNMLKEHIKASEKPEKPE